MECALSKHCTIKRLVRPPRALIKRFSLVSQVVELRTQIPDLRRQNKQLERIACLDGLTGLANRRAMHDALETDLPAALVLVDIDNMHDLNERFGHPAGDACLVAAAQAITRAIRPEDLAVRLGGDEFAVLVSGSLAQTHLDVLTQRLKRDVEAKASSIVKGESVTASVAGARLEWRDGFDTLYARADATLYRNKQNRVSRRG